MTSTGDRDRLARACEALLDGAVVVLASWTVVYHLCLLLDVGVLGALLAEAGVLVAAAVVAVRRRRRRVGTVASVGAEPAADPAAQPAADPADSLAADAPGARAVPERVGTPAWTRTEQVLLGATVAAAAVTAGLVAFDTAWALIAALWLVAAVAGTGWAAMRWRRGPDQITASGEAAGVSAPVTTRWWPARVDTAIAVVWAAALAVLAALTRWPNPDDLYYVNLAQWVVDNGTFAVRDTIFSDLAFPMSSWPPIASYDPMAGALAWVAGVPAASVVYLVVPPVATFLSVLAMWRLLREWRVPLLAVGLSLALVFLLFDGGPGYAAPGNLFLIRIWQGKVILLCLMVPLLLVYALRYVRRPSAARAGWLAAGGVAAVGLTTTAMFLVPLIAAAGAAPLLRRAPWRALGGFAAMAAYPLGAGVLTLAVGGRSADLFDERNLYRFDPAWFGHEIFRDGPVAAVAVLAVLTGALLVPRRSARVTTGLLALVTGITLIPGFTQLGYDLVGLGPTLWRVSWVASIAALVGVLAARATAAVRPRAVGALVPLGLAGVLMVSGLPIWSLANGVVVGAPAWKRSETSLETTDLALSVAEPGDVVLAPEQVSISIAVSTTEVKTVAPRAYFMDYLRDVPAFHFDERIRLVTFATTQPLLIDAPEIGRSLDTVGVDIVCLPLRAFDRIEVVRDHGFRSFGASRTDVCLQR